MEDPATVRLLTEIRELLERTVANQERVLRANDETLRIYRGAARRQLIGITVVVAFLFLYLFFLYRH